MCTNTCSKPLTPPTRNCASLRSRGHSYQLPEYSTDLHKKSFLIGSLYSFVTFKSLSEVLRHTNHQSSPRCGLLLRMLHVSWSVCTSSYVLGTSVSPGKPDEQIDTPFWGRQTCVDLRSDRAYNYKCG